MITLSDKIKDNLDYGCILKTEHVKEKVKDIKDDINKENSTNPDKNAILTRGQVLEIIDKHMGKRLT